MRRFVVALLLGLVSTQAIAVSCTATENGGSTGAASEVQYATVPIRDGSDSARIEASGAVLLTHEPSYVVVRGTAEQIAAIRAAGFAPRPPVESDYKRRLVKIPVRDARDANEVAGIISDAWPLAQFPGTLSGQAFDSEIEELRERGYRVEVVKP